MAFRFWQPEDFSGLCSVVECSVLYKAWLGHKCRSGSVGAATYCGSSAYQCSGSEERSDMVTAEGLGAHGLCFLGEILENAMGAFGDHHVPKIGFSSGSDGD